MRIAIVVGAFPTVSETFIINQITDLIDRGHDVLIFAFKRDDLKVVHQKISDYKLLEKTYYPHNICLPKYDRFISFFKFLIQSRKNLNYQRLVKTFNCFKKGFKVLGLKNYSKFKWILDKSSVDIIHVHFGTVALNIVEMRKLGYLSNAGFVVSFHGIDVSPKLLSEQPQLYKELFKEVDLVTVNSEYTRSLLRKISTLEKVRILPVGLASDEFRKTFINKPSKFTILFVGRLIQLKGPHIALKIFKILLNKGYTHLKLKIVGEGDLRKELESYISLNNMTEYVELLGALSQESVKKLMELSDLFLLPGIYDESGRSEAQGLVIQEAQAMELPVIVSDAGGMKEGMIDGETGFVIKENAIDAFAEKIEYLIKNEKMREKMGEKGRTYVRENYDSKILGKKLENYYKSIL